MITTSINATPIMKLFLKLPPEAAHPALSFWDRLSGSSLCREAQRRCLGKKRGVVCTEHSQTYRGTQTLAVDFLYTHQKAGEAQRSAFLKQACKFGFARCIFACSHMHVLTLLYPFLPSFFPIATHFWNTCRTYSLFTPRHWHNFAVSFIHEHL